MSSVREIFNDTYSGFFDTASVQERTQESHEASLVKMILSLDLPILSLPQVADSTHMHRLALAEDNKFLECLNKGLIVVSLYGSFKSLEDYVLYQMLENEDFIFSSLDFLNKLEKTSELKSVVRDILRNKIKNKVPNLNYPDEIKNHIGQLDAFVESIRILNESLKPENGNYCDNLKVTVDLKDVVWESVRMLNKNSGVVGIMRPWFDIVTEARKRPKHGNDRSEYYNCIDEDGSLDTDTAKKLKVLTDFLYNKAMGPRIASQSRLAADESNIFVRTLIEAERQLDNNADEKLDHELRWTVNQLYQEVHKDIPTPEGNKQFVDWEIFLYIVNEMESKFRDSDVNKRMLIDFLNKKSIEIRLDFEIRLDEEDRVRLPDVKMEFNNKCVEIIEEDYKEAEIMDGSDIVKDESLEHR